MKTENILTMKEIVASLTDKHGRNYLELAFYAHKFTEGIHAGKWAIIERFSDNLVSDVCETEADALDSFNTKHNFR